MNLPESSTLMSEAGRQSLLDLADRADRIADELARAVRDWDLPAEAGELLVDDGWRLALAAQRTRELAADAVTIEQRIAVMEAQFGQD
ncbi:hypothetical protein NLX83_16755 [Allokutzneria sp. A3M-2-11 16]|uniref:hypothetical protein n=1 Tax=Allokutzneria sp. A3M-2-11 16 TaxID=2962043 RepID=UPI0020B6ED8E|nr:hypothetical protein [Allokutzneria sp. A3M-2-11 16]MCP3800917.1 hypothetical protein [Allokutzneria sp. A3M-2-11 16]